MEYILLYKIDTNTNDHSIFNTIYEYNFRSIIVLKIFELIFTASIKGNFYMNQVVQDITIKNEIFWESNGQIYKRKYINFNRKNKVAINTKIIGKSNKMKTKFFCNIYFFWVIIDFKKVNFTYGKKLSDNKKVHITSENIKIHSLKILHWNKGNSLLKNKIDDINFILDKYKPHVISISEANYDNLEQLQISEYKVETNGLGVGHDFLDIYYLYIIQLNMTVERTMNKNTLQL